MDDDEQRRFQDLSLASWAGAGSDVWLYAVIGNDVYLCQVI